MKFKKALRLARPLIDLGVYTCICDALLEVDEEDQCNHTKKIMAQLDGCRTYDNWIFRNHLLVWREMNRDDGFRRGRLQWIDHMLK